MALAATKKNRSKIAASGEAGCLYCCEIFPSEQVVRSVYDDLQTSECPGCWLDFLVPGPITKDVLVAGREFVFREWRVSSTAPYLRQEVEFPPGTIRDSDLPAYYGDRRHSEAPDPGF